jgi:cyclopropane fatty-acyl-phospholipid synthase-like methyltransferase
VEDCEFLAGQGGRTLIEIGCGNGLFLEQAASRFDELHGCDWALSPHMAGLVQRHPHLHFHKVDLTREPLQLRADLIVSADVVEHFPPESLDDTLRKIDAAASRVYHKIACYDDGHSHLSVMEPEAWLERLKNIDRDYELLHVECRRENQHVAILGKQMRRVGKYRAA